MEEIRNKENYELIEKLERKREEYKQGGGPAKVEKLMHAKGKLSIRERIDLLFDQGTFVEQYLFAKSQCKDLGMDKIETPAEGIITGYGKINGRLAYFYGNDFTVMGGTLGRNSNLKSSYISMQAARVGAPLISMVDTAGARFQEGNMTQATSQMMVNIANSGYIPQVSAIMGNCAGGGAYIPALTEFIISVDKTSRMYICGPEPIKQAIHQEVDPEELSGGYTNNAISGNTQCLAEDDRDCIEKIRLYLSYMPQNCNEMPPVYACGQDPDAMIYELDDLVPDNFNRAFDMMHLIELVADRDSIFPIQPLFAKNLITVLARLDGHSVGIIANNPMHLAGCLDVDAADKMTHFVDTCDAFNIPLIWFTDCPGFMPGIDQEHKGIVRHGAKACYAMGMASAPKIGVVVRKQFGASAVAMGGFGQNMDMILHWPFFRSSSTNPEGSVKVIFRREIAAAADPEAKTKELAAEFTQVMGDVYTTAERLICNDIIAPHETRRRLIQELETLRTKNRDLVFQQIPKKRQGIRPV